MSAVWWHLAPGLPVERMVGGYPLVRDQAARIAFQALQWVSVSASARPDGTEGAEGGFIFHIKEGGGKFRHTKYTNV